MHIPRVVDRLCEYNYYADDLLYRHAGFIGQIWVANWKEISNVSIIPGHTLADDVWTIPEAWASGGAQRTSASRTIDFGEALPTTFRRDLSESEMALRRLKRLAIIMLLKRGRSTRRSGNLTVLPKPSTWVKSVRGLCRAAKIALNSRKLDHPSGCCPDGSPIFARLSPADVEEIRNTSSVNSFIGQVNALFQAGHFDDWPAPDVSGRQVESKPFEPLSDETVSAIGRVGIWFLDIGDDLLDCFEHLSEVDRTPEGLVKRYRVLEYRRQWLARWQGEKLKAGLELPFPVQVRGRDESKNTSDVLRIWPPRIPSGVRSLVTSLQSSNMCMLLLATGARDSEIIELKRDCLQTLDRLDVASGVTFKSAEGGTGDQRLWPLPRIAVRAIQVQRRLADIMEPDGDRLWVTFSRRVEGIISSCGFSVFRFSNVVFVGSKTIAEISGTSVHPHRFRKTVARLAALSIVGASQVLMEVLGHRDPDMTLNYILSDPELQDEMHEIASEALVALGEKVLLDTGTTGPAATSIEEFRRRLIPRFASDEMAQPDLKRAATILSQNGALSLVRPNVLCTKTRQQAGPCTRTAGIPDIGNCQSDCHHRLELSAGAADHKLALDQALKELPVAGELMRPWWISQIKGHVASLRGLGVDLSAVEPLLALNKC